MENCLVISKKLNIPYHSALPLLHVYLPRRNKVYVHAGVHWNFIIIILLETVQLSIFICFIHIMEYYSAIKRTSNIWCVQYDWHKAEWGKLEARVDNMWFDLCKHYRKCMLVYSNIKWIIGYLEPGEQGGRDLRGICGIWGVMDISVSWLWWWFHAHI